MASNFNKAERYVKQGDEYKLLSYATSSESVKMTDGTDLQSKIDGIDDTLSDIDSTIDGKIADLVNSAPETIDTLGEIAQAIEENQEVVDALDSAITNKVDKATANTMVKDVYINETSGNLTVEKLNGSTKEIQIRSTGDTEELKKLGLTVVDGLLCMTYSN